MTAVLPTPDIAGARLPVAYEQAKQALANCEAIDECQQWADKMAALASYARQAEDETLLKHAMRIQGRAVRRAGELLETFKNERARTDLHEGTLTQKKAADLAGMSEHQRVTAVRVANVPAEQFEAAVESDAPPTVTALAEMGRRPREAAPIVIDHTNGCDPAEYSLATEMLSMLRRHAEGIRGVDPRAVARGSSADEHRDALTHIAELRQWLETLQHELEIASGV